MESQTSMSRRRAAVLVAVHLAFALHFLHWKFAGRTLAPIEPSEMFDTLHLGVITVGFLFMAGAVAATAIAGRFFCGWGCHILALQDLCAWLLARLKIPTKPVRSRTLAWAPALAALYLFAWPPVQRWLAGEPLPRLHTVTDPQGWTSFTTTDLLRSFPGPWMTAATLGVCGFAIVYFLGSRSFCRYACPYGAIFAAAERAAPLRIVAGPGECSQCGLCIASCKSSVRVIDEVRTQGAVVDANCFRDLDCVHACPTGALRLGWATPPALRPAAGRRPARKPYDFTPGEDLLLGAAFLAALPVMRGLYEAVSFLLALAVAALLAYAAVIGLRLARREHTAFGRHALKRNGALTTQGRVAAAAIVALGGLFLHSAYVRYELWAGARELRRAAIPTHDPTLTATTAAAALGHFERAARWGLFRPRGLALQLAVLHLQAGAPTRAREELNRLLAADPADHEARLLTARAWLTDGHATIAAQHLEIIAAAARAGSLAAHSPQVAAGALSLLGDVAASEGRIADAGSRFDEAIRLDPRCVDALLGRGAMLAAEQKFADAARHFRRALAVEPRSAEGHNNLAAALARLGRRDEALEHYEQAADLDPDNPAAASNAGRLLLDAGRLDEAEAAYRRVLQADVLAADALAGIAEIERRRRAAAEGKEAPSPREPAEIHGQGATKDQSSR